MIYFIVNALAGGGLGARKADLITEIMDVKNVQYEIHVTQYRGHAGELAEELCEKPDITALVAVGGDGTVFEILNGMDMRVPLGIIPAGTGNDFARAIKVTGKTCEELLDAIVSGHSRRADYINVNTLRCLNVLGSGFDVDLLLREHKMRKLFKGSASYFAALLVTLFRFNFRHAEIVADGNKVYDGDIFLVALANGCFYGGGLPISPASDVFDGKIELTVIKKMPKIIIPWLLVKFLHGTLSSVKKYVMTIPCSSAEFSISPEVQVNIDGELTDQLPIKAEICDGGITLLVD